MSEERPDTPAGGAKTATLDRDLGDFLIQLSIGVHRLAMYPSGHPSAQPAVENVTSRLEVLLSSRQQLSIGVAQDQLIIEGVATDRKNAVLGDLARRLHEHQVGALVFEKGAQIDEIEGMLQTLAEDAERTGHPLGLLPANEIPDWDHVHLYGIGYEQLRLKGESPEDSTLVDRPTELWLGLARAAMAADDAFESGKGPSAGDVADSIRKTRKNEAYDQVIVGYLLQLSEELKSGGGESATIRAQVSELVKKLDEGTLERLVSMGGNSNQRKQFVLNASESLTAESVMKVLQAAASTDGQNISNSMTRLLTKLAMHAEEGGREVRHQADDALRENIEELLSDWELKDPNPDEYTLVLDQMAQASPIMLEEALEADEVGVSGAVRLLQMSLEIEAYGPTIQKAVSDTIDQGEVGLLLELLEESPEDSVVAERVRRHITSPGQVKRMLAGDQVDQKALSTIVDRMEEAAIEPLLDVLIDSDSRAVRRAVFDVLAGKGSIVGEPVMARLEDSRWFVLRNLISLLNHLDELPPDFDPGKYVDHDDERVRREAFPLAVARPELRQRTLANALADADERMVRMALAELEGELPEELVPTVVRRVVNSTHAEDVQAIGVRTLGSSGSDLAFETLLGLVTGGRSLLGRVKLAPKSRNVLEAIAALKRRWSQDPRGSAVLVQARKSGDPELERAAQGEVGA